MLVFKFYETFLIQDKFLYIGIYIIKHIEILYQINKSKKISFFKRRQFIITTTNSNLNKSLWHNVLIL